MKRLLRSEIYLADLDSISVNSMQSGERPVIIVSNNRNNENSPNVTVVALTTSETKSKLPTHVNISSTGRPCIALCETIMTIDRNLLKGNCLAICSPKEMMKVNMAMITQLGIDVLSLLKEFTEDAFKSIRRLNMYGKSA